MLMPPDRREICWLLPGCGAGMVGGVTGPAAEVCALAGRTHLADQIRLYGVIRLVGRYGDRSRPGEPVKQAAWGVR